MNCINQTKQLVTSLKRYFPKWLLAMVLVVYLALQIVVVFMPESTTWLENPLYDLRHRIAGQFRSVDPSIVIVGIDMRTLSSAGIKWPWPRTKTAEVLTRLSELKPRGIVLDILFQNLENEDSDRALEDAIRHSGNVVLISILEEKQSFEGVSLSKFSSISRFTNAAIAEGFVWGTICSDGKIRNFKVFDERLNSESCALTTVKNFGTHAPIDRIPREIPVVFAGRNGGIPVISLNEILSADKSRFVELKDKIVVLGVTAPVVHDYHNTPLGIISGAQILAASIDTILQQRIGRILYEFRLPRAFMSILGIVFAWFSVMCSSSLFLSLVAFALLWAAFMFVFEISFFYGPVSPFLCGWFFTMATIVIARYFVDLFSLQRMVLEAENARIVQDQLLPCDVLEAGAFKIGGLQKSADELGGDYFDYFLLKDRYLLLIIGDATGHGMPAALAVAVGKAAVLSALKFDLPLAGIAQHLARTLFLSLRRRLMMTAAFLWLDTQTGEYEYLNCGHPYPYKVCADGSVVQLEAYGLFLGTRESYKPGKSTKGTLNEGERMVFYSDGLVESLDKDKNVDAFEIFKEYLKSRPKLPLQECCADIINNHPFFATGEKQPDDFTVVVIEKNEKFNGNSVTK